MYVSSLDYQTLFAPPPIFCLKFLAVKVVQNTKSIKEVKARPTKILLKNFMKSRVVY